MAFPPDAVTRKHPYQDRGIVPQLLQDRGPTGEKKSLWAEMRVRIDIQESQWEGIKRSKRILQKGCME
jgi:hypothetical protein